MGGVGQGWEGRAVGRSGSGARLEEFVVGFGLGVGGRDVSLS